MNNNKAIDKEEPETNTQVKKRQYNFKPGNQFYLLRSKHGRDKLFETPKLLLKESYNYFNWCINNPLIEEQLVKYKDSYEVAEIKKTRPFTIKGLCLYLGVNHNYFNTFISQIKDNEDSVSVDFKITIARIQDIIYEQKFSNAAADLMNASFIGKAIGLVDKTEVDHKGKLSIAAGDGIELPDNGEVIE